MRLYTGLLCGTLRKAAIWLQCSRVKTLRTRIAPLQSRGQWGARDFSSLMWTLPIAEFDPSNPLHTALATAGHHAETIAAQVPLKEGVYFTTARRQIRKALAEDGVADEIDGLVQELLRGS